jgi:hypothetical protein
MNHYHSNPGVRFTLRKRSIRKNPDDVNISSYNSDFLSGLFNDVAKISEQSDSECSTKRGAEHVSSDAIDEPSLIVSESPNKKRCTSLSRCMSRSRISAMNLGSLAFQLDCVGGDDTNSPSSDTAATIAFPNLPATVSDSSCSAGLTRVNLIRQASSPEKQPKESFGWFVDLDDHQTVETRACLPYSVSNDDLAFQAPTAPHGSSNDAEVQWAKAADAVDDVLGDFF